MTKDWRDTGTYRVRAGDTLSSIAKHLGIDKDSLVLFNDIEDPDKIQTGQELFWRREPTFIGNILELVSPNNINSIIEKNIEISKSKSKSKNKKSYWEELTDSEKKSFNNITDVQKDVARKILDLSKRYGLTREQGLTLVANAWQESKLGLALKQNNGNAEGYWQFDNQTKKDFLKKYKKFGNLDQEFEFMLEHINNLKDTAFESVYKAITQIYDDPKLKEKNQNYINTILAKRYNPEISKFYKDTTGLYKGLSNLDLESMRKNNQGTVENWGTTRQSFYDAWNNSEDPEAMVEQFARVVERAGNPRIPVRQYAYQYFDNLYPNYKLGGKFTSKKSQLVKNAENQNTKRDMRKKFIKSDRSTYTNNRIRKNQEGGILDNQISIDPNLFSSWNAIESNIEIPTNDTNIPETKLDRFMELLDSRPSISPRLFDIERIDTEIQDNKPKSDKPKMDMTNPSKGTEEFNRIYDEVEKEYPEAAKYRAFLTTVAKYESGFNSKAKNKNAPAWGYFQFMQDDNKYNNIKTYAGVDTQAFLDDPKLQIIAAINLAKSMEKGFSKEDIAAAESKGITKWGMLGGAWLGGNGGLRRYLLQNENISDKHWGGAGIDMINQIKRYNFE